MSELIFLGGEVPSHRNLLIATGAQSIGINYWALKRRGLPKTKDYLLSERYPEETKIYADSGVSTSLKSNLSLMELEAYCEEYQEWVSINEDRLSGATEFSHPILGEDWIENQRDSFWSYTTPGIFWPLWSVEQGPVELLDLAKEYGNVAIPGAAIETELTLASRVRAIKSQYDVDIHGIACAKPDNLRQVPFTTASTMSWLSPMMRGETIVWDGKKLVRYPKKMKAQARPRYKRIIESAGLDFSKIMDDDPNEVTRLAIWSYLQLEKTLDKNRPMLSDNSDDMDDPGSAETGGTNPDNSVVHVRKELAPREPSEARTLPVFGVEQRTIMDKDSSGRDVLRDAPVLYSNSQSLRQCDTCFVAANCPAFTPQSACAFNLPVEVKTKDQLRSLLNAIIEMQGQRVAFARFSEELNGGYPDPNTGQEIDRLFKIVEQLKKLESNNEFVRMTVERQTSGGILSNLFGDKASVLNQLPNDGLSEESVTEIIIDQIEG
ncbi:hypothetical protein UFOVP621_103 [uncultured Caudovirales phage]|uniref:Uncharacterized protein n=1 Tax=uncultured Caudovirales phage TaxID=2100421 RepID=A0A6J5N4M5_9CAUD|nr:hypothetical protein UFOVP621_103 [uncultured Caudovirales phage]